MSAHEHWQMDASAPELYERYLVPAITSVWANDLLDRIAPRRGESVLDIACGTGVVARLAAQRRHAGRLTGIDLKTAMLAVARAKSATIEWIEGSALDLPFETNSFDVVLGFAPTYRTAPPERRSDGEVRLGSLASIRRRPCHVCSCPNCGSSGRGPDLLLWAQFRTWNVSEPNSRNCVRPSFAGVSETPVIVPQARYWKTAAKTV